MLTDLMWLMPGKVYPPESEKKRLDTYRQNERLFMSEHAEALREYFHAIANKTRKKKFEVETVINYQQLLSKKTADFVCGEPPVIETEGSLDRLAAMLKAQRWDTHLYEGFIDVSRFGNAVLKIVDRRVTAVSPLYWFPIVDVSDVKAVRQHVIAYPVSPDDKGTPRQLYAEIHNAGSVEIRLYEYDGDTGKIGALAQAAATAATGLDGFAVVTLTNVTHSGSLYGVDDYNIVNSIIAKIIWRLFCIDNVLDKHSDPSVSGPQSALSYDERFKTYYLDLGNYFSRNSAEDPEMKYMTWDGNLTAAYQEIELLLEQLYTLSEMGQALMVGGGGGEANSGTALKLRMVAPRIKAARLANLNDDAVRKLIIMLARVNGITIAPESLSLTWRDGLPNDETEQINTLVTATGGGAVMSLYSALKQLGLSDEVIETEIELIRQDAAANAPALFSHSVADDGEP